MNDAADRSVRLDVGREKAGQARELATVSVSQPYLNWLHFKSWLLGVTIMIVAPRVLDSVAPIVASQILSLILGLSLMQRPRFGAPNRLREFSFNLSGVLAAFAIRYLIRGSLS